MSMTFAAVQKDTAFRNATPFPPMMSAEGASQPANLKAHLDILNTFAQSIRFVRNETVFQEGDRAHFIYRIVTGTVRLCRHTPDGRRHIAEFALPGDLFGVFGGPAQAFTAEAVGDVVLVAYPRGQFDRLSERDPRFRASILAHLSTHLMTAQLHTFWLGCQNAKERLASFLMRHAERTGGLEIGRIELSMGRQDIADHLGLTIETICRAVTQLKNEGAIQVPNNHQIVLRNVEALCELADGNTDN
jgi:CRP-like cAMP-binding protein